VLYGIFTFFLLRQMINPDMKRMFIRSAVKAKKTLLVDDLSGIYEHVKENIHEYQKNITEFNCTEINT